MTAKFQYELQRWRVVIPNRDASAVLMSTDDGLLMFPEVRIPQNQRIARNLNSALRRNYGLDVVSIVPLDISAHATGQESIRYHIAELFSPNNSRLGSLQWIPLSSLPQQALATVTDFTAVDECTDAVAWRNNNISPFGHLGWFEELGTWLQQVLKPLGARWSGVFEQFHASASFSLIRFETTPWVTWFKAVGKPNIREFPITMELAKHYSPYVPKLLAVRSEWHAWLAQDCAGQILGDCLDHDLWRKAAESLAQLQIASLGHIESLRAAGAHDLHRFFSSTRVAQFFAEATNLVAQNRKPAQADVSLDDLPNIEAHLEELIGRLSKKRMPETLGHLDLNAGNAIVSAEQCVYLDWAEAYLGLPFLTLEYLLQSYRRVFGRQSVQESAVINTYLTFWERIVPTDDIHEVWALTAPLAVFAYGVRCLEACGPERLAAPGIAEYMRALLGKLKRELDKSQALSARV